MYFSLAGSRPSSKNFPPCSINYENQHLQTPIQSWKLGTEAFCVYATLNSNLFIYFICILYTPNWRKVIENTKYQIGIIILMIFIKDKTREIVKK